MRYLHTPARHETRHRLNKLPSPPNKRRPTLTRLARPGKFNNTPEHAPKPLYMYEYFPRGFKARPPQMGCWVCSPPGLQQGTPQHGTPKRGCWRVGDITRLGGWERRKEVLRSVFCVFSLSFYVSSSDLGPLAVCITPSLPTCVLCCVCVVFCMACMAWHLGGHRRDEEGCGQAGKQKGVGSLAGR